MPVFYCVRHGMTVDDLPGSEKVTGWLEVPLNADGRVNARKAAVLLKAKGITSIVASDIKRTMQTAEIIGAELKLPVIKSEKLRSWNMGAMQGMLAETAKPFLTFFQKKPNATPPEGEKFQSFYSRFKNAWDSTITYVRKFPNAKPLLITHSQNLDIAPWFIKGIEPGRSLEFGEGVPPGAVLEVTVEGEKISIRKLRVG